MCPFASIRPPESPTMKISLPTLSRTRHGRGHSTARTPKLDAGSGAGGPPLLVVRSPVPHMEDELLRAGDHLVVRLAQLA